MSACDLNHCSDRATRLVRVITYAYWGSTITLRCDFHARVLAERNGIVATSRPLEAAS